MRAALCALILTLPLTAAGWVRVRTPEIELLTDAGEKSGRETLERLIRIRDLFPANRSGDAALALRIFLFSSEREFRQYAQGAATEGFFQSGPERDYIVLHAGAAPSRVVIHEYIHLLLNHGSAPMPTWLEEGLAEFYSTIDVQRGRLVVGLPIASHAGVLGSGKWLTAAELDAVNRADSLRDERTRAGIFYAQSWALAHMLNLSPAYRDGFPRFAELLASGRDSLGAFQQAFGKPLEEAVKDLRGYLNRLRPVTVDAAAEAPVVSAETSRVAEIDATLLRAGLALRTSHPDLAQRLFEQAAREHPGTPAAEAGMGTLALASGDKDAARRHLERAIELGSTEADAWFEYAMLERESGADRERVEQLLGKTVALNPNFAEAHFLLGVRATDDRQYDAAVEHLEAAVHVLPRQSSFWHALAYALDKQGRRADAVQAARRAVLTATDTTQERMAQALLDGLLHP